MISLHEIGIFYNPQASIQQTFTFYFIWINKMVSEIKEFFVIFCKNIAEY